MSAPGVERIAEAFAAARAEGRAAALMPYLMGGYPDRERSLELGRAYVEGGADVIELGVPFSDPLADGPVIHAAADAALAAGATVAGVLELGRELAGRVPVVAMCYSNTILARGLERFLDTLAAAAFSGLIVPDLPHEEAGPAREACDARGLALVPLLAPSTPPERMHEIARSARGFVYLVSLAGTTGERSEMGAGLGGLIAAARAAAEVPVAVGFGIGNPEQAARVAADGAQGVIVGSRLVRAAGECTPAQVEDLVREFSAALRTPPLG